MISDERRVQLLLRCYPRKWRERYGEEFAALLEDELADGSRSRHRDADVVRSALLARAARYGLVAGQQPDRSAAALSGAAAAAVFVAAIGSIWTQLADGWLTAQPAHAPVTLSLVALSAWFAGALLIALAWSGQVIAGTARAARHGELAAVQSPLTLLVASVSVLVAGVRVTGPLWPGAHTAHGGGWLSHVAQITWSMTAAISTFWIHPTRLRALPASELVWMAVAPVAVLALAWSVARIAQVSQAHRTPRSAAWLGGPALVMSVAPAAAWVVGSQHAANPTYRAGTLDLALITAMAVAAYVLRSVSMTARATP